VSKVKVFDTDKLPFQYSIRINKRAKRLNLKLSSEKGVELVVPAFTPKIEAQHFLQKHTAWIMKNAALWQPAYEPVHAPQEIALLGGEQVWQLAYDDSGVYKRPRLIEHADNFVLHYVGENDVEQHIKKCRQWVEKKATAYLTRRLLELSEQCQLPYKSISFRKQKTRWGSCSAHKAISLNLKLIFLSPDLIDYVIIHELAHTKYLDHGKRFWRLVSELKLNYKACVILLKRNEQVPRWF
jgi:predicted metal-dependent hydrolase